MIKIIREVTKEELKDWVYDIDIKDPNIYKELENQNMIGIFQLTGGTAKRLVEDIHPDNFNEVNAVNAMSRPGPIENAPIYLARKNGEVSPYPELMNEILKDTYSVPIYQEQIMEIFHKIGGFSLEEADEVRSLMKKLGKTEKNTDDLKRWDRVVKKFVRGATKNEIEEAMAERIANELVSFSGYSFNLSHSTSYSYIAAMTLYLSVYFRKYFYSAYTKDKDDKELLELLNNMKMQGFEIAPPDINRSGIYFTPGEEKQVYFGLSKIKHVSENSANAIIENRPYHSIIDFIIKNRSVGRTITSSVIKALISAGAFDNFNKNRKKLLFIFNKFWDKKGNTKIEEKLMALYKQAEEEAGRIPGLETSITDEINYEKEYLGFNFFATLFTKEKTKAFTEMSKRKLINLGFYSVEEISKKVPVIINSIRAFKDKNDNSMAFIEIEDMFGQKERIPIFHSYFQFIGEELKSSTMYLMNLYRSDDGKIMFGQKGWIDNKFKIQRMIREI